MKPERKCPICQGEFEKGGISSGAMYTNWQKGWEGLLGTSPKDQKRVETYRCKNCGYLESYAK